MSKIAVAISNHTSQTIHTISDCLNTQPDELKERLRNYFETFADKVDQDTLTFKEGAAIFLAGGLIVQVFVWFGLLCQ